MPEFSLEFILSTHDSHSETIRQSLIEFSEELEILPAEEHNSKDANDFKVKIRTEEPTIIFDLCAQFGRITSVKINEG